jgi:hypothetical protein
MLYSEQFDAATSSPRLLVAGLQEMNGPLDARLKQGNDQ